jgi:hypothetical protein
MASEFDFLDEPPPPKPVALPPRNPAPARHEPRPSPRQEPPLTKSPVNSVGRTLPHSLEAEEYLLSCCLLDGSDTIARCLETRLTGAMFFSPANALIYKKLCELYQTNPPVEMAVLAQSLKDSGHLSAIGGYAYLMQISARIPTTAQAVYFLNKVKELYAIRELILAATSTVEQAFQYTGGLDEFLAETRAKIEHIGMNGTNGVGHGLMEFTVPPDNDRSVLLGNRYLNRGDGGVLSSTSGMGKSSISLQMAAEWARGRDFAGIKPNGPLKSLIIQSEDSAGDIGEVSASLRHGLKLTAADSDLLSQRVIIHTERVARGAVFIAMLRRLIGKHKPDLVWINPLQAFMEGDVTQGQDLSAFLRGGLNSLNEPPSFGYILVHHTTKPSTGKERSDRLWHEVMYDMAGGAEIINWARFVMSLRATATDGEFNLVLAKRGRRAGVTQLVEQGAGTREEAITTIPLRHAHERIKLDGHDRTMPLIFWEPREADKLDENGKPEGVKKGGAPEKYPFSMFRSIFPAKNEPGKKLAELHRLAVQNVPIPAKTLHGVLQRYAASGLIQVIETPTEPMRYRLAM